MEGKHIRNRVISILDELPKSERKIAELVLEEPEKVILMTASKLAEASKTSPATVIRFCRSVGIPSFTALKLRLSAEIDAPNYPSYSDITPGESISDIKNKLLTNAYHSMKETIHLLDDRVVEQVVEELNKASIIYAYGVGASNLVAENIAQKWNRIGKTTICLSDPHLVLSIIVSAPKHAVFIGISNSGETEEVLKLTRIAKQHDILTIGLSQFGSNHLTQEVDIAVNTVRAKEAEVRSAATSSLLTQFMAIDVLFYAYVSRNYEENIDQIRTSREAIKNYRRSNK